MLCNDEILVYGHVEDHPDEKMINNEI